MATLPSIHSPDQKNGSQGFIHGFIDLIDSSASIDTPVYRVRYRFTPAEQLAVDICWSYRPAPWGKKKCLNQSKAKNPSRANYCYL